MESNFALSFSWLSPTDIKPHPKQSCLAFQRTAGSRLADCGSQHHTGKTTRVSLRLILHRALRQIKEILEAKFPRVIFTKAPYAHISHTPNTAIAAFERTAVTKWNTDPRFAHQTGHECHCHWCSGHSGKQRPCWNHGDSAVRAPSEGRAEEEEQRTATPIN